MRKITPFGFLLILTLMIGALPGCSWLQGACSKAMPYLALGQAYGADAAQAIEQAESYAAGLNLPPATKATLQVALEDARKGLRIGQIALGTAADACTQLDPLAAFEVLIKAWGQVRTVLASTGPIGMAPGARVGGYPFDDPAIYRLSVSRQP